MNRIPRIFLVLALTLLLAFGAPTAAHAQSIIYGDTIPAGAAWMRTGTAGEDGENENVKAARCIRVI